MDDTMMELQRQVETARTVYMNERAALQSLLVPLYQDPADACGCVVSAADEFGVDFAHEQFQRPMAYGAFLDAAIEMAPETDTALRDQLERLMDAHERLDKATAEREDALQARDPAHVRVIHFDGHEFEIDNVTGHMHAVDDAQHRFALADVVRPGPEPKLAQASLTQRVGQDVPAAQPTPERSHERRR